MDLLKTQQIRHVLVGFFSSQVFQLASLLLNCIATFTCSSLPSGRLLSSMAARSVRAMSLFRTVFFLSVTFLCTRVTALASTGTIPWGGNNTRAGYRDSAVVGSAQFG